MCWVNLTAWLIPKLQQPQEMCWWKICSTNTQTLFQTDQFVFLSSRRMNSNPEALSSGLGFLTFPSSMHGTDFIAERKLNDIHPKPEWFIGLTIGKFAKAPWQTNWAFTPFVHFSGSKLQSRIVVLKHECKQAIQNITLSWKVVNTSSN